MSQTAGISCELGNVRSITGVLKFIELLCDILAVILGAAAPLIDGASGHKGWFLFVSVLALIVTLILLIILVLNVQTVFLRGRWPLIEFVWCVIIAIFYFIASVVVATIAKYNGTYGAAAFFGFAAMITYIADAVFQFRAYRAGGSASRGDTYATSYPPNPTYPGNAGYSGNTGYSGGTSYPPNPSYPSQTQNLPH